MKFCKIYSNFDNQFHNIEFHDGLNVVLAEIADKTKLDKDTHNLGKTLLISIIDFLLLKTISNKAKYFLTKGGFEGQLFFLELELNIGKYLIIRRGVDAPTKISFKVNDFKLEGFETRIDWDEEDLSFEDAKEKLNEYLGFDVVPKWKYRKAATYFLRTQNDFRDVFKLDKFMGPHKDWKPFVFDLLGFDGDVILQKYELEDEINELKKKLETLQQEADINIEERDKISGLLDIKNDDKRKIEEKIDKFDFYEKDKAINKKLVEEIDSRIQILNTKRYGLSIEMKKIESSLSVNQSSIDIDKLNELYKDVEIYFPDQLVNDYKMLIEFNKSITAERNIVLQENLVDVKNEFESVSKDLRSNEIEKERYLSYLTEKDSYFKFKESQKQLAKDEADIIQLENKLKAIDRSSVFVRDIETKEHEVSEKIKGIHYLINQQKHSEIRRIFNSIIKQILNVSALISLKQNKQGNVEFNAHIQNPIDLTVTAEDYGMTYRKLLCMAFDLSLLVYYSKRFFYRFVYHDGALEALDDRKKVKFLNLVRELCSDYNFQYILTLIDSDLPKDENGNAIPFPENEICLKLHDRDDAGRLFKKSF